MYIAFSRKSVGVHVYGGLTSANLDLGLQYLECFRANLLLALAHHILSNLDILCVNRICRIPWKILR